MTLLIYYVVLTLLGSGVAVMIGLGTERFWPAASLPVFLVLYFGMLWGPVEARTGSAWRSTRPASRMT
jgi:hypothetical protein